MIGRGRYFEILYVFLLVISFFEIDTGIKDVIFALLFGLLLIFYLRTRKGKEPPSRESTHIRKKIVKVFIVIMAVFLFVSLVVLNSNGLIDLFPDNFITVGMILLSVFLSFLTNEQFGEKNIRYICVAVLINYVLVLIMYGANMIMGVDQSWGGFLGMKAITTLEIHELAFVAGILLIYLIGSGAYKEHMAITILIAFITIVDFKRVSFIAFAIIMLIQIVHRFILKDLRKTIRLTKILTYIIVFLYLALMTVFLDQTLTTINNIGINMSWRDHFYRMIYSNRSDYSPLLGTGIRSTDYRMSIDPRWNFIGAIHSDILRLFLENGIVLFTIYIVAFVSYFSNVLKKVVDKRLQLTYSFLILFTMVCYTTDNLFTYYRYIFVLFSLIFAITTIKTKRKKEENAKEIG